MENKFHLSTIVFEQAKKYGDRAAMYYRDHEKKEWLPVSWNEFANQIQLAAEALIELGVKEGDRVGIFSQNMYEIIVADFANFAVKATSVPLYATSTAAQIEFIVKDTDMKLMFAGEQYQFDVAKVVASRDNTLSTIIAVDPSVELQADKHTLFFSNLLELGMKVDHKAIIEANKLKAKEEDLVNIMYTSGTAGNPKGVLLLQSNYSGAIVANNDRLALSDKARVMNFLPITHIFERAWAYLCIQNGATMYVNQYPVEILTTILEVRPTHMCAVPRYWEKVYAAINEKIDSMSWISQGLFRWAIKVGKRYNVDYLRLGKKPPALLSRYYNFASKSIFEKVKKAAGIENGSFFPCAGARLSDEINEFMHSLGINICYGYGLTESTATVSCFHPEVHKKYIIGSVGPIVKGVKVKISEEGEILLKGKTILSGYYNRPEATKEAFTEDGWFKTGDAGNIDHENNLYITDRIKDLYKTAGGKYVAPQLLEGLLCDDKMIDQVATIGNERKYVAALIVPDLEQLKSFAIEKGIVYKKSVELIEHPMVIERYENVIKERTKDLAKYEQIKSFKLLSKPFTMENGHLTNTLKLRRKAINESFSSEIASLYPNE